MCGSGMPSASPNPVVAGNAECNARNTHAYMTLFTLSMRTILHLVCFLGVESRRKHVDMTLEST
jgi:hypothetical protein